MEPDLTKISFDHVRQAINDIGDCDGQRALHLTTLIEAAHAYLEAHTKRSILTQAWELTITAPSETVQLPRGPVTEVTHVEHATGNGECWQKLPYSDWEYSEGCLWLRGDATYPCGAKPRLRVFYVAGAAELERMEFLALSMLVGHWDYNRIATSDIKQHTVPLGFEGVVSILRNRYLHSAV